MYFLINWLLVEGIFTLEINTPIKDQAWQIFYQILMDYSRKKPNRGGGGRREGMEFLGILKKEYVEVPGVN